MPIHDRHVLTLDVAGFLQALEERNGHVLVVIISRLGAEEPDHRHRRLLRSPHHGPRRRAPNSRDELPSFHSITSSARSRIDCSTVRPSALAALTLTAISNLVGT